MAAATPVGLQDHDLVDFFHREESARMARMARLPPTTALTPGALSWGALRRGARPRTRGVAGGFGQPHPASTGFVFLCFDTCLPSPQMRLKMPPIWPRV